MSVCMNIYIRYTMRFIMCTTKQQRTLQCTTQQIKRRWMRNERAREKETATENVKSHMNEWESMSKWVKKIVVQQSIGRA